MTICYFHEGTHLVTSDAVDQGESLLIPALLSRTGSYPDKNVSFSAADFDRAIARFSGVSLNYNHKAGPLDGRLGQLQTIWREGEILFGNIRAPKWVLQALRGPRGDRPKLSAEWELQGKLLNGLAWTDNPRIEGAGLIAAFSASVATFADAPPYRHFFHSVPLHEDHVKTLKTHWNLSQQFPADDGNRQLKGTLRMLEHLDSGSRILDSIVNPEGK